MDDFENPFHSPSYENEQNQSGDFGKGLSNYPKSATTNKSSASEITITIKNEEKRQVTKHLIYEVYTVSEDDMVIKQLIAQALQQFNADPDDVRIRITLNLV